MNFPGWKSTKDTPPIYSRSHNGRNAVVSKLDGWNWGWVVSDGRGEISQGRCNSRLDVFDAITEAEEALGIPSAAVS